MSTTYQDAQDRVMALITLGGWSNSLTPPNPAFLVNWGKQEFIRATDYNQERTTVTTIANQAEYSLTPTTDPRKWYSINDDALWNLLPGTPGNGSYMPQTTRQKLRQTDIQYLDCPAGVPMCWYVSNDQTIGLYPAPSQDGIIIGFSGNRDLPDLQEADDTFPWHDRYTEAVCLYGAYYHGKTIARGEELQTLGRYLKEATDLAQEFSADFNDKEAALINRRVAQPAQDYLLAGDFAIPVYQSPSAYYPGLT